MALNNGVAKVDTSPFVSVHHVANWLRHVDRLTEIPGAAIGMPTYNPLWDAANALEQKFGAT